MNLTEALKTKKEKLVLENDLQEGFIEKVRSTELNKLWDYRISESFIDYINQDIKKRAQTIGIAFNIGAKIIMELLIPANIRLSYLDNGFFNKYREDLEMKRVVAELGDDYVKLFDRATDTNRMRNLYKRLDKYDGDKLVYCDSAVLSIADIAVSLAWLKAKYISGFFPADITVMLKNSETHVKMVEEVHRLLLLMVTGYLSGDQELYSTGAIDVYIEPTIVDDETGLYEVVDFIADGIAYDSTTSSTYDKDKLDTTRLKSFKALNEKVKKYDIDKYSINYIRHHITITFE